MKRLIVLFAVVLFVLTLVVCVNTEKATESSPMPEFIGTLYTFHFSTLDTTIVYTYEDVVNMTAEERSLLNSAALRSLIIREPEASDTTLHKAIISLLP